MRGAVQGAIALVLLGAGGGTAAWLIGRKPPPPSTQPAAQPPLVSVVPVRLGDRTLRVRTYGTVVPRTEMTLQAEVAGRIVSATAAFEQGRFFEAGELLAQIDPADYRLALAQAEARRAQATLRLAQEEAEAKLARRELGTEATDPLALREPQLAEARASLAAAEAAVEQARLNLERTRVRAPFAGRVRAKSADVGQFVAAGTPLARLYAVDAAEVRLPIALEELAFVDLPLDARGNGPPVLLRATVGGAPESWEARVVRVEAEVDPKTRMIHAVARAEKPYAAAGRPPLMVGLFVEAEIRGRTVAGVAALPRSALRPDGTVLVADPGARLRVRPVTLLRIEGETALISGGLAEGERVCVHPLETASDGTVVRVREEPGP
jgi:RND family efflux transporter MFP subunit